jgi:ribosomal-protein-alanine N-acetyltransferase
VPRVPVAVRDAVPADAAAIARVARTSWTDAYRDIFDPSFIEEFLERNYAPALLAAQAEACLDRMDRHFLVAERDGEVIAYAQYGVGERGPELYRLYADPAHYGTGAGSALLDDLHRRLDGRVDAYLLDVHSRNARGRAFYDRKGFVIVGGGATPDCDLTLRRTLRPPRPTLPIQTERLRLRALSDDDETVERLHAIYGDAQTMQYIGTSGTPASDVATTRRILGRLVEHGRLHGFTLWAVDERDDEPLVGLCGLMWVEGHGPEVEAAYLFRRDRWGCGYASEALRAVLGVAHRELGLERVVALAYPDNDASRRVMEKAGMRADGHREAYGRTLTRHVSEVGAG